MRLGRARQSSPFPGWRWAVVLAGAAVLCSLPVLASALPASVPRTTAKQLEDRILASRNQSFAGYAESDAAFGLPPFPAFSGVTPLLDGVTRMRVWQVSPDRWRVDTLSDAGEDDTYQLGDDTYVWDSGEQLLTGIFGQQNVRLPRAADLVPSALAFRIITEAGPRAGLRVLPPRRVGGVSAAGLAVVPASPQSTIGQADVWADPATGLPLLVQVFGRGKTAPALTTEFLQAGLWRPDPATITPQRGPGTGFTSTTPAGFAGVLQDLDDEVLPGQLGGLSRLPSPPGFGQVGVYGGGLATFAVLTLHPGDGGQFLQAALDAGATRLTFTDGTGAEASAPLVNLVLVHPYASPDTFLLVGLVSKDTLEQAASVLAAKPDQDQGS